MNPQPHNPLLLIPFLSFLLATLYLTCYDFSLDNPPEISWLAWASGVPLLKMVSDSKLRPMPTLSLGADGTEQTNWEANRPVGTLAPRITERYYLDVARSFRTGWRPLNILGFELSQAKSGTRIRDDSLRTLIAMDIADLEAAKWDSSAYRDPTGAFDRERWQRDYDREVERQKQEIFWKAFGAFFVDDEFTQSFSANFSPVLFSWLGTEANYSSRYRWTWSVYLTLSSKFIQSKEIIPHPLLPLDFRSQLG